MPTIAELAAATLDTISEKTSGAGVTIDSCLVKDGYAAGPPTASIFASTEQTGTGSSQNVAHGLGTTPRMVWFSVSELDAGLVGGLDVAMGAHDATNLKFTVTSGMKFFAFALK